MRPLRYSINVTLDGCCDHRVILPDEHLHRHAVENLNRAAKAGDIPMLRLLLAAKADYTTPTELHTTPLMVAAGVGCVTGQWIEPEHDILETIKLLVEELKADVNVRNDRNETALHGAACRAMDSVVQYLADKGAVLDVRHSDNMRPLDIVVDGIAKPVSIGGVPIEKIGYSDHASALLRKLMADRH